MNVLDCTHQAENCLVQTKLSWSSIANAHVLEVRVQCSRCLRDFVFPGLPAAMNLKSAHVSHDGKTAVLIGLPAKIAATVTRLDRPDNVFTK